ncbi:MAG: DUF222 domain-containing protein [Actinobacteria bacterium]|nr:DUF222 domain-containing protein [Actinomycetota bacterium]
MVAELLEKIAEILDVLADLPECDLGTGDQVLDLHGLKNRMEALVAQATAGFDASGQWRADGAYNAARWIAWRTHEPLVSAKAELRLGRAMREMEAVANAWAGGEISRHHVGVLSKARTDQAAEAFDRDVKSLLDDAKELNYGAFKRTVAYWSLEADPDAADRSYKEKDDGRNLYCSKSFEDCYLGEFSLAPIGGEIFYNELKRIEEAMFEADMAGAKERVGAHASYLDCNRTPAHRRADALVEMAIRSATMPAGRRPAPLFSVFVNYETICELARGAIIPPGRAVAVARRSAARAGRVRLAVACHRRRLGATAVPRSHPSCCRSPRPAVLSPELRPSRRRLPDRPHPTVA